MIAQGFSNQQIARELSTLLQLTPGLEVAGEAANGLEAVRQAEQLKPDVVLRDLAMPGLDGIEATRQIVERGLASGVMVLTIHGHAEARQGAAQASASAFIEKGTDNVLLDQRCSLVWWHMAFFQLDKVGYYAYTHLA